MTVGELVDARIYGSEEEALRDAFRHLLRARPEVRILLAVHRFQNEGLSLAKAAGQAGVSWAQMRDILVEKGIQTGLGPESVDEAEEEVRALRSVLSDARVSSSDEDPQARRAAT
jgi:predicted HTH domain antitoxin